MSLSGLLESATEDSSRVGRVGIREYPQMCPYIGHMWLWAELAIGALICMCPAALAHQGDRRQPTNLGADSLSGGGRTVSEASTKGFLLDRPLNLIEVLNPMERAVKCLVAFLG